jgi:hypothetical protein
VQVGRTAEQLLRTAGQPDRRPDRTWKYCSTLPDGREGYVTAVMTAAGRVGLVASRNRQHRASEIGIGDRASRLRGKARPFGRRDVLVRRLRGGNRFVYGIRAGRVRWTAVASGAVGRSAPELRRALRLAGLR